MGVSCGGLPAPRTPWPAFKKAGENWLENFSGVPAEGAGPPLIGSGGLVLFVGRRGRIGVADGSFGRWKIPAARGGRRRALRALKAPGPGPGAFGLAAPGAEGPPGPPNAAAPLLPCRKARGPGAAAAFWRGQRPRQNRPAAGHSPAAGGWAEPTRRRPPGPLDKLQRQERPQPSFPRRKTKRPGMPSRLSEPLKKGLRRVLWQDQVHDHGGEGGDHHRGAAEHGPHPSGEAGKGAGNRGDALAQGHG